MDSWHKGKRNLITDVPGVVVGHTTIRSNDSNTGVTVIVPCEGNVYLRKPVAAAYALNGYGKTIGTMQIDELGVLETPIALTNTLNVGIVSDALIQYTLDQCANIDSRVVSVNPVVGETNDSRINRIENRTVKCEHVYGALRDASPYFEQGNVGAGTGTVCFGLKGGIGSASRVLYFAGKEYTIGVLVQSNFGRLEDLKIEGFMPGEIIQEMLHQKSRVEKGSIMIVVATDIPLSSRQLKRVLKRAAVGMIRTGSYMGNGSGDIIIGFTNGSFMPDQIGEGFLCQNCFPENQIDKIFRPTADAVEEAIVNSMLYAKEEKGLDGTVFHCLKEFMMGGK